MFLENKFQKQRMLCIFPKHYTAEVKSKLQCPEHLNFVEIITTSLRMGTGLGDL